MYELHGSIPLTFSLVTVLAAPRDTTPLDRLTQPATLVWAR
jgi:hypothetical protein